MPPSFDGISSDFQFYWCDGDGNYAPLKEIKDIAFDVKEQSHKYIAFEDIFEASFSISMTPESSKRFKKFLKQTTNMLNRKRRTAKRRKEKARRNKLKGVYDESLYRNGR